MIWKFYYLFSWEESNASIWISIYHLTLTANVRVLNKNDWRVNTFVICCFNEIYDSYYRMMGKFCDCLFSSAFCRMKNPQKLKSQTLLTELLNIHWPCDSYKREGILYSMKNKWILYTSLNKTKMKCVSNMTNRYTFSPKSYL